MPGGVSMQLRGQNRLPVLLLAAFAIAAVPTATSLSAGYHDGRARVMSRSQFASAMISSGAIFQIDRAHAAMYDNGPNIDAMPPPTKLPSGVTYQDLRPGSGDVTVKEGTRVNLQWSLKRSNGYSVDSSAQNDGVPFIFTVGDTTKNGAIPGLDEGVRGARLGAIRRLVIPPDLAYVDGVDDGCRGPLPQGFGPRQRYDA